MSGSAKAKKECEKTMMCNWDKCQQEELDVQNARLTDEDVKKCENKDFKKAFSCQDKLTKKKGLWDKLAILANCKANKCPQIRSYIQQKQSKNIEKHFNSLAKRKPNSKFSVVAECLTKNCSKEQEEVEQLSKQEIDKIYECEAKYKTWKEQRKCTLPFGKKTQKSRKTLYKCRTKHCNLKET